MASITAAASFLGGGLSVSGKPSISHRRAVMAKAAAKQEGEQIENKGNGSSNRRDVMFAAAAAAICSIAAGQGAANAEEPKRGTPEAKKIYAPVCVTMPTAKICYK